MSPSLAKAVAAVATEMNIHEDNPSQEQITAGATEMVPTATTTTSSKIQQDRLDPLTEQALMQAVSSKWTQLANI